MGPVLGPYWDRTLAFQAWHNRADPFALNTIEESMMRLKAVAAAAAAAAAAAEVDSIPAIFCFRQCVTGRTSPASSSSRGRTSIQTGSSSPSGLAGQP